MRNRFTPLRGVSWMHVQLHKGPAAVSWMHVQVFEPSSAVSWMHVRVRGAGRRWVETLRVGVARAGLAARAGVGGTVHKGIAPDRRAAARAVPPVLPVGDE